MARALPLDPPLYSLGWVLRQTIALVVKLNEDFHFLLCCAIDVGESMNRFILRRGSEYKTTHVQDDS